MNKIINDFIDSVSKNNEITSSLVLFNDIKYNVVFLQQFVDIRRFNYEVKPFINQNNISYLDKEYLGICKKITLLTTDNLEYLLYSGMILIFFEDYYYSFDYAFKPKRTVSQNYLDPDDPLSSKDSLIEDLGDNLTLIKKRIKSNQLIVTKYQLGLLSKTDTALLYLKDFHDHLKLNEVLSKLDQKMVNTINNINDLNTLFQDRSLVPLVFNTSSPEIICESLLKGRIVLLLDNSPIALILPANLTTFTVSKNYVNCPLYFNIFNHIFISIFFLFSIFFLGLFIAIINFHPEVLSITFLNNLKITERGTSWPMFIEVIIIFLLFEFYRFSTSRSTNNYIQNIIIILGGLFIGQNAINSGAIGATTLFLTSIAYISVFAITNNLFLITSINIFRLFILILSYTMGLIGFLVGSFIVIFYLYKPSNTNQFYLYPLLPFNLDDFKALFTPSKKKTQVTK